MTSLRAPLRATTICHADRLFPADLSTRMLARRLYESVRGLPLVCSGVVADPSWFAENPALPDPAQVFVQSDRQVWAILRGHGVAPGQLGVADDGASIAGDPASVWKVFAANYHAFRGTPTRLWHDHAFSTLFGLNERLSADNSDRFYTRVAECLAKPEFRPRALFQRFNIELLSALATPFDSLDPYLAARGSLKGRLVPTYCPDRLVDANNPGFITALDRFAELTSTDAWTWKGYLDAHRQRRAQFKSAGALAISQFALAARTADLPAEDAEKLFAKIVSRDFSPAEGDLFRAQMATEMARMSLDDGLVLQLHLDTPPVHDPEQKVPPPMPSVDGLLPLLQRFRGEPGLRVVACQDGLSAQADELARLASEYACLFVSAGGSGGSEPMRRFRAMSFQNAAFYKTLNALQGQRFIALAALTDAIRRLDCAFLAEFVVAHRLDEDEAHAMAKDVAYGISKKVYHLSDARG